GGRSAAGGHPATARTIRRSGRRQESSGCSWLVSLKRRSKKAFHGTRRGRGRHGHLTHFDKSPRVAPWPPSHIQSAPVPARPPMWCVQCCARSPCPASDTASSPHIPEPGDTPPPHTLRT